MSSCKYYFGKVFAHFAGALAISAISSEYSNLGEELLGGTSKLVSTLLNFAIIFVLMYGIILTKPGNPLKYVFFIGFAFWFGQLLKPLIDNMQDKKSLTQTLVLTSGVFAAMTALGFYDSMNILGFGPYLFAGLVGLIFAQLLVLALGTPEEKKEGIQWLRLIGIALFSIFTAYDIQVLRVNAMICRKGKKGFQPDYPRDSIGIYLDFINLFTRIGGDD